MTGSNEVDPGHAPKAPDAQIERLVSAILAQAAPELERLRKGRNVFDTMMTWRRPILATAAGITAAGLSFILLIDVGVTPTTVASPATAEIPSAVVAWLGQQEPDVAAMVSLFGDAER